MWWCRSIKTMKASTTVQLRNRRELVGLIGEHLDTLKHMSIKLSDTRIVNSTIFGCKLVLRVVYYTESVPVGDSPFHCLQGLP